MIWQNTYRQGKKNVIAFVGAFVLATAAFGDDLQDVKTLMQDGKLADALTRANKLIEKRPTDPSLMFVKGLILSEQKKTGEAIEVFSRLTTDHPNYPEPYNNLAVLFAMDGQYAKARIALETALKLNPKYTTAQENLGDVYLQSALQAYGDAARDDADSAGLKVKLRGVRSTLGLPLTDASGPAKGMQPVALALGGAKGASSTANKTTEGQAERDVVLKAVDQWVRAWSAKDVKSYLDSYASDFRPPRGETRSQWERNRRARISSKDQIEIQVLSPSVTVEDKIAVVNFQQVYVAGKISSNARKSLTLKNDSGKWKILQEKSDG